MASLPDPEKGEASHGLSDTERSLSVHSDASLEGKTDHGEEKSTIQQTQDDTNLPATAVVDPLGAVPLVGIPVSRLHSRASSARSLRPNIVPRSKRRGLFGRFAILPEVDDPYLYKTSTKWGITVIISLATCISPMGSSIFYPALPVLSKEFHASSTVTNLSIAMYMIAQAIFPLWWSSFSEEYGRRSVYLISFSLFVVFSVLSAVSVDMPMLIVFRILGGASSSSVQAVGSGSIADVWPVVTRGHAMGYYYLGPLLGPLVAPIIGGALTQFLGWQSTMYFLAIYGFIVLVLIFFLLPETLHQRKSESEPADAQVLDRTSTKTSVKSSGKKAAARMKRFLIDPLAVLLYLRFPPVAITVAIVSFAFCALFVSNIAIQQVFSIPPYNYSQLIIGLLYVPPGLGYIVASVFGGKWIDRIMAREARKAGRYDENGKLVYLPEDRMKENMWIALAVYPLSLLWFGWALKYELHFMVSSVALFFFGVSSMLVFAAGTTMLTEFVHSNSSGGVAINNCVRNILSSIGTIVAAAWIDGIGVGWVFTMMCIICLVTGYIGIWALKRYASKWRVAIDQVLNSS